MEIGSRIKKFRKLAGLTQAQLAEKANMSRSYIADIERDRYNPSIETLQTISAALNVEVTKLLEDSETPYYYLNSKDERDIARDLEKMMNDLETKEAIAFYGEPLDDEDKELLRISLENSLRLAKEMAKKKFTPKKFRN